MNVHMIKRSESESYLISARKIKQKTRSKKEKKVVEDIIRWGLQKQGKIFSNTVEIIEYIKKYNIKDIDILTFELNFVKNEDLRIKGRR